MSNLHQRTETILSALKQRQMVTIGELAQQCDVSEITIRRDLKKLQEQGIVAVAGGSVSLNLSTERLPIGDKYYLAQQAHIHRDEKIRIGKAAAALLEPHETIVIDMGSTPYFFARAIPDGLPLTVICYSLNTFIELHERRQFTIVFAGGVFDPDSLICEGPEALETMGRLRAHKSFITASGLCDGAGLTTSNFNEQAMKRAALRVGRTRYLLLDSSKFGVIRSAHVADLDAFDAVITDDGISDEYRALVEDAGLALHVV